MACKGPTVIIVGAPRSGTTTLFNVLSGHPNIRGSRAKEPYYFHLSEPRPSLEELAKSIGREIPFGAHRWQKSVWKIASRFKSRNEYEGLWVPGTKHRIEATPCYMYDRLVPERIARAYPDVRIIALLRHPVRRSVSQWAMNFRAHKDPISNVDDVFKSEPVDVDEFWWGMRNYLRHSMYGKQLARYFSLFQRERVRILVYEEFFSGFDKSLSGLLEWLDVSDWKADGGGWNEPRKAPVDDCFASRWMSMFKDEVAQVEAFLGRTVEAWH